MKRVFRAVTVGALFALAASEGNASGSKKHDLLGSIRSLKDGESPCPGAEGVD